MVPVSRSLSIVAVRRLAGIPLAALVVHQLRLELAFSGRADRGELGRHLSMNHVLPWVLVAVGFVLCASVFLVFGVGRDTDHQRGSARRRWTQLTLTLIAFFVMQELVEGAVTGGHLPGLAEVVGQGGWWALPAAMAVAGAIVIAGRGEEALTRLLRGGLPQAVGRMCATSSLAPVAVALYAMAPLAGLAAGRAPPPLRSVV